MIEGHLEGDLEYLEFIPFDHSQRVFADAWTSVFWYFIWLQTFKLISKICWEVKQNSASKQSQASLSSNEYEWIL